MDFYARHIFARFMDRSMRHMNDLRSETLASAHGEVLEVGFGTGLNLRYYPTSVSKLAALDPLDALQARVQRRIASVSFPVERFVLGADNGLPFEAESFDCVAMTWTLCSIREPLAALAEMRRVLRRDGVLLFIEHGRSEDPAVARWQARLNPIHRRVACGCELVRPIDALIRKGGFELMELRRFALEDVPRIFGETYQGIARTQA